MAVAVLRWGAARVPLQTQRLADERPASVAAPVWAVGGRPSAPASASAATAPGPRRGCRGRTRKKSRRSGDVSNRQPTG